MSDSPLEIRYGKTFGGKYIVYAQRGVEMVTLVETTTDFKAERAATFLSSTLSVVAPEVMFLTPIRDDDPSPEAMAEYRKQRRRAKT